MKRRQFILVFLPVLLLHGVPCRGHIQEELTLDQAVQAAEKFIALNGYTDLPPTEDHSKLSYESITFFREGVPESENIRRLLKMRHDTLERRAYAYLNRNRRKLGWTIVFRYSKSAPAHYGTKSDAFDKRGRAVAMDLDGRHLRVEHSDAILKAFEKIPSPKK